MNAANARLLVIWEHDGGIRAGFARLADGSHCYFEQLWGEADYLDEVVLKPVSREIVQMAKEAREIFVEWERRRAQRLEDGSTRPDIPGRHPRYWQLYTEIDAVLKRTAPLRVPKRMRRVAPATTATALPPASHDDGGPTIRFEDIR